ncbi:MAG: succinate dehydrogenase, hydrophobic membrane anchor protein [Chromatiales bacterium]|jgi:succinate dehydrogenase / fumarate reductase membrane anchor subunit|nr:succinate dehydrogenase, hydrophobic membrane anchor protein [Chromatiales bacterium]
MSLKSPLGRVLGLGAAGEGPGHWWAQRLSAAALVPLTLWFALSVAGIDAGNYYVVDAWLSRPLNALLAILLVLAATYHASLGVQVVAEDYIHAPGPRAVLLGLLRLAHVALAVGGVFAVVVVATGGAA